MFCPLQEIELLCFFYFGDIGHRYPLATDEMSYEPLLGKRGQFIQPFKVILNLFQMSRDGSWSSFLFLTDQGLVSLTFRELSKIFSRNLCIAKIVLRMRISSWNFVCVPKAMLWAHVQSFSLKFYHKWDFWHCVFSQDFFEELAKR